jgi:hypothetical protein
MADLYTARPGNVEFCGLCEGGGLALLIYDVKIWA